MYVHKQCMHAGINTRIHINAYVPGINIIIEAINTTKFTYAIAIKVILIKCKCTASQIYYLL